MGWNGASFVARHFSTPVFASLAGLRDLANASPRDRLRLIDISLNITFSGLVFASTH